MLLLNRTFEIVLSKMQEKRGLIMPTLLQKAVFSLLNPIPNGRLSISVGILVSLRRVSIRTVPDITTVAAISVTLFKLKLSEYRAIGGLHHSVT
jgi:hypothetical protein